MASITSLTLLRVHPRSLKWLVKHRNTDSITPQHCVGWLVGWLCPSPGCHPHPCSTPCSTAACEPSVLWVIESSCSCWAEVRVLQSAPQPWTEHTGIPQSLPNLGWNSAPSLPLSPLVQLQINLALLSLSLFPFSISWHTVTPLIKIINQPGRIRPRIKINYTQQPPLRSPINAATHSPAPPSTFTE